MGILVSFFQGSLINLSPVGDIFNMSEGPFDSLNLDAGQPEVVQRGSPWYEKKLLFH